MKYLITAVVFITGCFAGYWLHPNPTWDIGEDDRACVISWDDGTYNYKSKRVKIGTLKPGESKTIKPFEILGGKP